VTEAFSLGALWNPEKELKEWYGMCHGGSISTLVESGEGIESGSRAGGRRAEVEPCLVESGEGIESTPCDGVYISPQLRLWNPVKELKVSAMIAS